MRIVLSFQLFYYSRWSGYSAIIFACASTYVFLPAPGEMIHYALYIFDWNTANWFCLHPDSHEFRVCFYIVWSLLIVWLVLMPIITLSIKKIIFKFPKWSWCIIVPFAITALLGLQGYILNKYFILGIVLVCFLPELYWIIVNGKKKSLANAIYRNKPLVYYCAFVALFLCSITIGFKNLYIMRPIGLLCFPAIFYILLGKSVGLRNIPTYDTIFMCITGSIYWYCLESGELERITGFVISALILMVIAVRLTKFTSSKFIGISLVVGSVFVLFPALWGMNPYVVLNASHTRLYMKKLGSYHGLYVTDNFDGKCGLRDRYGEILPMKYSTIDILEPICYHQYILCCLDAKSDNVAGREYDECYSFFNLRSRQFIEVPDDVPVKHIEPIRKGVYALFNETDSPAFYLVMPWCGGNGDDGIYCRDVQIIDKRNTSAIRYDNIEFSEDAETFLSSDGKIRLISWNTGLGGTSPDYTSYIQYMENDSLNTDFFYPHSVGKYVCASDLQKNGYEVYEGSRIDGLWQIDIEGESPLYIVATYNRASSIEGNTLVYVLQFDENGKLIKKQFLDNRDEFSDRVGRDYYIPDWYFTTDGMGWNWVVSFDDRTQCLYVSESHDDMVMNDRYDVYHYEKGRMTYKRTDAGYWLHPSVREFSYLCGIYRIEGRLYRVDSTGNSYRLSIWNSNKTMSDEPEMILYNGQETDNYIQFTSDSNTFIVPLYRKGQGNDFDKVILMKDGEIIEENEI